MNSLFRSICVLLCAGTQVLAALDEREAARKHVSVQFDTTESMSAWDYHKLAFPAWTEMVSMPGSILVADLQTDEWFVAVFQMNSHLVVWTLPRKEQQGQMSLGVVAVPPAKSGEVVMQPFQWVSLHYTLNWPGGAIMGREQGSAYTIAESYQGLIKITYEHMMPDGFSKTVFSETIPWPNQ